jgi:hypothetical protein
VVASVNVPAPRLTSPPSAAASLWNGCFESTV